MPYVAPRPSPRVRSMIVSYKKLQSMRLVAKEFGVVKGTVGKALKHYAPHILRVPYKTYKWERPKTRKRRFWASEGNMVYLPPSK